MRGILLDTNIALLAVHRSSLLSRAIRDAVQQGPNFLSVLSYWEVVLKAGKGKLDAGDPQRWWLATQRDLKASVVPLLGSHITAIATLSAIHQDPFDRALMAQAIVEDLMFVTTDQTIPRYGSAALRILS